MCHKVVNKCFFVFDSVSDRNKTQEMCDTVISEDPSLIVYCPDKYKTQGMCDEAVDDCLTALKLVPDWFITSKMIEEIFIALYADENILYFNEGSSDSVFNCYGMGIHNIYLNNINLDNHFDEGDPDPIILIRILGWHIKFEKRKELKEELSEEVMAVAWHPIR